MDYNNISNSNNKFVAEPVANYSTYKNSELIMHYSIDINSLISKNTQKTNSIKLINLKDRINGFKSLKANWDSYNAEPISKYAIYAAIDLLSSLNKKGYLSFDSGINVNIFPMRDGGIQFDIDNLDFSIEIEIDIKGDLSLLHFNNNRDIVEEKKSIDIYELAYILDGITENLYYA